MVSMALMASARRTGNRRTAFAPYANPLYRLPSGTASAYQVAVRPPEAPSVVGDVSDAGEPAAKMALITLAETPFQA